MATDLDRFVAAEGREARVADVRRRIDAEGITYIYYQFISVTGRIMGKGVPAPHWESMAAKGFQLVYGSTANLFVDRHGDYIGYGPEAAELVGIPEPETFEVLPWDSKVARVWCTLLPQSRGTGGPGVLPHRRLPRQPEAGAGRVRGGDRLPSPGRHRARDDVAEHEGGRHARRQGVTKPYCYHIDQFSQLQPIIHKVVDYGQALGLDMIQGDHEDAPGQIELNFRFDRAEQTADNISTYRQICRQVGRELNVFPCFMPKPFMGVSANGCHHNISLWRDDDERVPPRDGGSATSEPGRAVGDRRHPRAPRRADRDLVTDGQLVPPALGHGLLGAGLRGLGLPEPHDGAARLGARAVRVPLRRLGREPVPLDVRPDHGDVGRDRAKARSGRAGGAKHLRCMEAGKEVKKIPMTFGDALDALEADEVDQEGDARRDVHRVHALQARRVGALLRRRHRLGASRSTSTSSRDRQGELNRSCVESQESSTRTVSIRSGRT